MTAELVAACVAENASWCALVCRSHGIGTERAGGWTRTLRPAPTHYPDLITLDPSITSTEVSEQLRDRDVCSVKDSYARLDLTADGFALLFEAQWLAGSVPTERTPPQLWHVVRDADEFERWRTAHGDVPSLRPALLDDDDTRLWRRDDGSPAAGFVAHRTGEVVAVSNAFTSGTGGGNGELWRDILGLATTGFDRAVDLTVVAYEPMESLGPPMAAGLRPIGPLRVWLRSPAP